MNRLPSPDGPDGLRPSSPPKQIGRDHANDPVVAIHGDYFYEGQGGSKVPNQIAVTARFAVDNEIHFDRGSGCFRQYCPEHGCHVQIDDDEVKWKLSAFLSDLATDCGANSFLSKRTNALLNSLLDLLRGYRANVDPTYTNRNLFHVGNGMLEITKEGVTLLPFDARYRSITFCSIKYNVEAKCPSFLYELLGPAAVPEDMDLLHRWLGSLLTGRNDAQRFMVLYGAALTGKSTLVDIAEQILGQHKRIGQEEKNRALSKAVKNRRRDILELLVEYGADPKTITWQRVIWNGQPEVIRWFVERNHFDMESEFPIAKALWERHREFLGVYMDLRDRVPTARMQAAMALRMYCQEGNMKWVCLLLWAGADPREPVPYLDKPHEKDFYATALETAVVNGQLEIVKKIKLDPEKDDMTALLNQCFLCKEPAMVQMLLDAGADPNRMVGDRNAMQQLVQNFCWSLDTEHWRSYAEQALRCVEIAASFGGRWRPSDTHAYTWLRTAIAKSNDYRMPDYVERLVNSGAIEREPFQKLMSTPKMKEWLNARTMVAARLRKFAGIRQDRKGIRRSSVGEASETQSRCTRTPRTPVCESLDNMDGAIKRSNGDP